MKLLDLFAGIGGFSLAAHWMGWETVAFVEKDEFCQKVLRKNFGENIEIHDDITRFSGKPFRGRIDIVTGGFPCQPFSENGKRKGKDDARYLWPAMLRVITEVAPAYIVAENVSGSWIIFDEICSQMESLGYKTEPCSIEAACVGADTLRERYWFISYSESNRNNKRSESYRRTETSGWPDLLCERSGGLTTSNEGYAQSGIRRIADDVPNRMDRLRSLGNTIVPRIAYEIFKAIEASEGAR